MKNLPMYISLIGINLIYATVTLFTKGASQCEPLSIGYFTMLCGAVAVMVIYAILWQQIIKRIDVSTAYMFKGTTIVFVMLFAYLLFQEPITWNNIIGSVIIISGITLYAKG